jgi:hypothetical protein
MMVFDIKQNPNEEELKEIIEAVEANEGYCPCALEKNEDTKCMCKVFRDSQETDFCHCGRFYKVKDYETVALIGDISDYTSQENYIDWYERLIYQNFIVLGIPLNLYDFHCGSVEHFNLCKSIIANADAVVVLGHSQKLYSMVADLIEWAGSIGKKVLTREDLVNEN